MIFVKDKNQAGRSDYYSDHRTLSEQFIVLGQAERLALLHILNSEGEKKVSDLSESIHTNMSSTSQHLRVLRDANFVTFRREKAFVYYSLNRDAIVDFIEHATSYIN